MDCDAARYDTISTMILPARPPIQGAADKGHVSGSTSMTEPSTRRHQILSRALLARFPVPKILVAGLLGLCVLLSANVALANMTKFDFRITNNSDADLRFTLNEESKKNIRFSPQTNGRDHYTVKAKSSATVTLTPRNAKYCAPLCGACIAAKGTLHVSYTDTDGTQVENNYYKADYGFSEYCSESGNKPITTYSSSWEFEHHKGKGDDKYPHAQSHHTPVVTKGTSAGNTYDGNHTKGYAEITYENP